jgi:rRNA maturation RNase YbeY
MAIKFVNQTSFKLSNKKALKKSLEQVFSFEKKTLKEVIYVFCDDIFMLNLNNIHLKHNYLTDILTFDLTEKKDGIAAEIYISVDRLKDNSDEYKTLFINELYRVMIHGILHLCGYHDSTAVEKEEMRKREEYYINTLFKCST